MLVGTVFATPSIVHVTMKVTNDLSGMLADPQLFRQQAFIAGKWVDADSQGTVDVLNPATDELVGTVPDMGAAETRRAIEAAVDAWPAWRERTGKERGAVLRRWFELIREHQDDLAILMTAECGKPLAESRGEVMYGASFVEWYSEEAKRIYGEIIPTHAPGKRILVTKQPVGVVGAITPWNFPSAMIARKCAPALAVGCPVVVKPSELTPFSALALAELADRAGLPSGLFNVVVGADAAAIGSELCANPTVRKLGFTGSTAVGKLLMRQAASTVKKVSLELGGNAPLLVFDDADLDAAVDGAVASKFRNAGQTCVCANRILVQEGIYDAFATKLAESVGTLRQGSGFDDGARLGPLINARAVAKAEAHVQDALGKGATLLLGGSRVPELGVLFRADRARRCDLGDADCPRRDLWPRRAALPIPHRGGGGEAGQRHAVRARGVCLHPEPRPCVARGGGLGGGHGGSQRGDPGDGGGAVWRRQGERPRARGVPRRRGRVRRDQIRAARGLGGAMS